jgi:hypothetical protein
MWSKDLKNFVSFDDYYGLMLVTRESKSKFILPYLASYITDLSRLEHFRYMNLAPDEMYYCDTDSIFTTSKLYDKHVSPDIGKLKFLGTFTGIFLSPKTYALRDERTDEEIITFKGFDPDEFTFSDFQKALKGELTLKMTKEKPMSFKECNRFEKMREQNKLSKLVIVREDGRYLKVNKTTKQVSNFYDRRVLIAPHRQYGFDTVPFYYEDI